MKALKLTPYTESEKETLRSIRRHYEAFGYWPTTSQLSDFLGKSNPYVNHTLRSLVEKGGVQKRGYTWAVIDPRYNPTGVLERMGHITLEEVCMGSTQMIQADEDFPDLEVKKGDLILVAPVYDRRWVYVRTTKSWLTGKVVGFVRRVRNGDSHGDDVE